MGSSANDGKRCTVCGDTEPFHVHDRGERIEDYFVVGRGQTGFDAARAWKARALSAERTLAAAQPEQGDDGRPTMMLATLEVGTTPGLKHLEDWPAGLSLCGIDLFPEDRDEAPGFGRRGGRSDWNTPCPECVRRARRFTGQRTVTFDGMGADEFRAALAAEREEGQDG